MDAPVFVILNQDGTPKEGLALLAFLTNDKTGKSYFAVNGEGTPGQIFNFGCKVDADTLPLGVNTRFGLMTDAKEIIEVVKTDGKRGEKRLSMPTFTHGGEQWHVSPGLSSLSTQDDGTCNLRLNVVRGEASTGFSKKQPVKAERVPLS